MKNLFNYRRPQHATATLRALQAHFPQHHFVAVESPLPAYAFRYLIRVKMADTGTHAFVVRVPRAMFSRLYTTTPQKV